jgi:hypothetical protein
MTLTLRKAGLAAILIVATGLVPFCSQTRIDQAVLDQADRDAADARRAAKGAEQSAGEAVGAAKAAEKAVGDLQAVTGPGS